MAEEQALPVSFSAPLLQGNNSPSATFRSNFVANLQDRAQGRQSTTETHLLLSLNVAWNLVIVIVSLVVLRSTQTESSNIPISIWICGYALQSLVEVVLVVIDVFAVRNNGSTSRIVKLCKTINNMISFAWWIAGIYLVASASDILQHNFPHLYWLAVALLLIRVFIAVIVCIAVPCICCCLPYIIAITGSAEATDTESDPSVAQSEGQLVPEDGELAGKHVQ